MKNIPAFKLMLAVALLSSGCASREIVYERGWMGGSYKLAAPRAAFQSSKVVPAFPASVAKEQEAGIFVSTVYSNTPAALAGLRAGDLILQVDHHPVESLKAFWKRIESTQPGTRVPLKVFRDGEVREFSVTAGRESFRRERAIGLGLLLSREWDLLPNPDFSLIALGFRRSEQRLELHSPESKYRRGVKTLDGKEPDSKKGVYSREGWQTWLPILSLSVHKKIVTQEIVEPAMASNAADR